MDLFFSNYKANDKYVVMNEIDSKHISRSFRKNIGDSIMITNGFGYLCNAEIIEIGKRIKEDFNDKKLPLMIAMIDAILDDKKLNSLYEFGKNIGLAFQVVDDILDFTGDDKQLGKPAVSDLASGYLTAPVLYALEENKNLSVLINRELVEKEDLNNALNIVMNSQAIKRSR